MYIPVVPSEKPPSLVTRVNSPSHPKLINYSLPNPHFLFRELHLLFVLVVVPGPEGFTTPYTSHNIRSSSSNNLTFHLQCTLTLYMDLVPSVSQV